MKIFKESKKAPMKLRGFDFIGFHSDYETCCYYKKDIGGDNIELMEVMLEGTPKKLELGIGTKVQVLDVFMVNHLNNIINKNEYKSHKAFIEASINHSFNSLENAEKSKFVKMYTKNVPKEVSKSETFKKYIDKDYKVLYCTNSEDEGQQFATVYVVLVKNEHVESMDDRIDIKRDYTLFKPFRFMVTPSYIRGESKTKYYEEELPQIIVNHDILNK